MLMGVSIFDATVAFLFLNMYVRLINDQITVNTYSVTEDLHFVSEHFYELQGAGTLFANNQRCVPRLPIRSDVINPPLCSTPRVDVFPAYCELSMSIKSLHHWPFSV